MSHPRVRPIERYQVNMLLTGDAGWTDVSIAERRIAVGVLTYRDGWKANEIATKLGITERTVVRARAALRDRERVITFPRES